MRVIIDTNVLVSGLISRSGPPAQIINAVLRGEIVPVMSDVTFAELEEVLHRPRL
ncbi:MAG: putative toxin-antitoxin system toxin component, PIN family [Pseudomonadota bacterium]